MSNRTSAVLSWLLVTAGIAVALKVADRIPAFVAGTPHGARLYRTVADAEQATGSPLWLPAEVPPSIDWPPFRVDAWPGPPVSVAVRARRRAEPGEHLVIVQSIGAPAPAPAQLLDPLEPLLVTEVAVGPHRAVLTRGLEPSGRLVQDLAWDAGMRRLTVRYAGPVEELLKLAAAFERKRP